MATCPTCRTRYPDSEKVCATDGEPLLPDQAFLAADVTLEPGLAVGEYEIVRKIGEGGFGAVYEARHPLIGKSAAVKVLHRQYCSNPQVVSRFIAEARAVNQIKHRNIIDIFSFGALPDGRQYYVMEFVDGVTFDRFLKGKGRLEPEEAVPILRGIARALDAAHAQGITHRDLKPDNVFISFDEDGNPIPKLLDFGIAKLTDDQVAHKTRTGAPMGTPNYMSPEQCRGVNVDHRTDVYAFGVLTFLVLTGELPFRAPQVMDLMIMHINDAPPAPSSVCPELRPELDPPILAMMAKSPEERPQSVGEGLEWLAMVAREVGYDVPLPPKKATTVRGGAGTTIVGDRRATGHDATHLGATGRPPTRGGATSTTGGRASQAATPLDVKPPTLLDAERDVAVPPPGKSRVLIASVGALAVGAIAGLLLLGRGGSGQAPTTGAASTTAAQTAAPPPATSTSAPSAAVVAPTASVAPAEQVQITVQTAAKNAKVFSGDKLLGPAGSAISLPKGSVEVILVVRADGFADKELRVKPDQSREVDVKLAPKGGSVDKDLTY